MSAPIIAPTPAEVLVADAERTAAAAEADAEAAREVAAAAGRAEQHAADALATAAAAAEAAREAHESAAATADKAEATWQGTQTAAAWQNVERARSLRDQSAVRASTAAAARETATADHHTAHRRTIAATSDAERAAAKATFEALSPTDQAKYAMGWLHTARFLTTAAQLHHLPVYDLPEIAFVGRSNAGKSTCINVLTQQKRLAYASKTPGRTQHINLFALGKQGVTDAVLADLPGYGYAAVAKMDKLRWQQVMANYLVSRENLMGIVMMCDPRHGLTELDDILLEVIRPRVEQGLKFLIILTKADKLTRAEQALWMG